MTDACGTGEAGGLREARSGIRPSRATLAAALVAALAIAGGGFAVVEGWRPGFAPPPSDPGPLAGSWRSLAKAGRGPSTVEVAPGRIAVDGVWHQARYAVAKGGVMVESDAAFAGAYRIGDPNMAVSPGAVLMRLAR